MKHLSAVTETDAPSDPIEDRPSQEGRRKAIDSDSLLFSSLLMPSWTTEGRPPAMTNSSQPLSHAPATQADWLVNSEAALSLNRLENQVCEQLDDGPHAIACTLLLPRLGEVKLDASLHQDDWHIDLTFLQAPALAYARRQHPHLAQRLGERLGRHVILGLYLRGEEPLDD